MMSEVISFVSCRVSCRQLTVYKNKNEDAWARRPGYGYKKNDHAWTRRPGYGYKKRRRLDEAPWTDGRRATTDDLRPQLSFPKTQRSGRSSSASPPSLLRRDWPWQQHVGHLCNLVPSQAKATPLAPWPSPVGKTIFFFVISLFWLNLDYAHRLVSS